MSHTFTKKNPSAEQAWARLNERQRQHALEFAGFEWVAAKRYVATRWGLLPRVFRDRLTASWEVTTTRGSRGTTRRMQAVHNPSSAVRQAREAKVKQLLIRIKAILQAAEQKFASGRRREAGESYRRAEALWDQMPKGVAMTSPRTRREAYELSRRMVRLQNRGVLFNKRRAGRNTGERYLIQGIRPKHRNWVTIDYAHDLNRALLNALHRAKLGNVTYRVWDTEKVEEVWRGTGKEATIEGWKATRPSGLVGANRRTTMKTSEGERWLYVEDAKGRLIGKTRGLPSVMASTLKKEGLHFFTTPGGNYVRYRIYGKTRRGAGRNPRLSGRMLPLRDNTMRLGDAMKWGRKLLDAGVRIGLWDGSGWEVDIRPDDSYATPSGRAAKGGRAYLAKGAGLIKTWPITLLAPEMKPGYWLTPPAIAHYLRHRRLGVASNPACASVLCNPWYYGYKKTGGVEKFHSSRKPTEASHGRRYGAVTGPFKKPGDMDKMYGFGWQAGPHTIVRRGKVTAARNAGETLADLDRMFYELQDELKAMDKAGMGKSKEYLDKLMALAALSKRRLASAGIVIRGAGKNPRRRSGRMGVAKSAQNSSTVGENARIAHEQIVEAFLAGRPKKVGPRYWTDGKLLRVWGNLVAAKTPGGIELYDAGYRTLLTKNVLNTVLQHMGQGTIWQQARRWYISTPSGKVEWTGSWTIPTGAAANRGRRVRRNGRGENLTIADIGQWIDNDEGLYNWWRGSRQSKAAFIRDNRAELDASIRKALAPREKTWRDYAGTNPRVRAWNIVAITPGRGREIMQSGHKDKKKAEDIAKVYQRIAKKEHRRTRYAVEPFRYSDWATRMPKKNPVEGWVVTRDGETLKTFGSKPAGADAAFKWLLSRQGQSVSWAIKHEGYDIVCVVGGKIVYSMKRNFLAKKNPLTRGESATLLRQARMHVTTARHDRAAKKHGVASYAAGRAQGKASAVSQFGPRGARRAAWKVLNRQAATNPHAGLKGLMNKGAARNAQRFARI